MNEQEVRVEAICAAARIVEAFKGNGEWTAQGVVEIAVVFEYYINNGWEEIVIEQEKV